MKQRGFEIVSTYQGQGIRLPQRKTVCSAGYDIESAATVHVTPNGIAIVPTGLKAYMQPNEYLGVHIRSGLAVKNQIAMINAQGIIDADYYNNSTNEGHILLALMNFGAETFLIEKGMRIAQGIFYTYLTTDDDQADGERRGGFGSTGC